MSISGNYVNLLCLWGMGGGGVIEGVTKFTPMCVQVRESLKLFPLLQEKILYAQSTFKHLQIKSVCFGHVFIN